MQFHVKTKSAFDRWHINASCAVSRYLGRFLLSVFLDDFLFDLTLSITSISPQFDDVRLPLVKFQRIRWVSFCCEPFGVSEPCVSLVGGMTQLKAALMK